VLLPTPWRVQVSIGANTLDTGLPAEVGVNVGRAITGPLVVGMLPRGASMIDELNGNVYKVARRRLLGDGSSAILTLDSAISTTDLLLPGNSDLLPERDLRRTVWVFPPAVALERDGDGNPYFDAASPVVGIEVRTITITPQ
jgi:hypothetical protein